MAAREVKVTSEIDSELLFKSMRGREELGRLFRYELELLHERHDLAPVDFLGRDITVHVAAYGGKTRYFHGLVAHAAYVGNLGIYGRYEVALVPWLWFLTRRTDCRIFQHKSVPDIISSVFESWPIANFEPKLDESYTTREYCVQYRESDFDFVSRLLEDEGIYYYFQHRENEHTLILADSVSAHEPATDYAQVPYFSPEEHARRERDHIFDWRSLAHVRAGKTTLRAFDFEKPRADLTSTGTEPKPHALATGEAYDYPGTYVELAAGEREARLRLEELQADHARCLAETTAVGLGCGHRFELQRHPRKEQNKAYLVTGADYEIVGSDYRSGQEELGEVFRSRLEVLDLTLPYRPARTTPRPFVHGPQTAIVTGPPGEEIYTDKYGRVKVQFHWDRLGKRDQDSSCWIRVSQAWAGAGFGSIHIPRIGQEVIIDFLEGDPDQPIITGRVYNALNMPPHGLPAGAVNSGIKSNSTKGGGGSNELTFDDTKGKEKVTLHAQYDMSSTVEHDETAHVKNNRSATVDVDETLTVHGNRSRTVDGNDTIKVGANREETITGNEKTHTTGTLAATVDGAVTIDYGTSRTMTIGAADEVTVTGGAKLTVNGSSREVGVPSGTYKVEAVKVEITGMTEITLKVGGSSIKIDPSGVSIMGPIVKLN